MSRLLIVGALGAFLAACSGEAASPGDTPTPVETPTPPAATATVAPSATLTLPDPTDLEAARAFIDELNAAIAADSAENPLYTGPLGDFDVYSGFDLPVVSPCRTTAVEIPSPEAELFFTLPNGETPDSANVCADGTATWVFGASARGGMSVERYYYTSDRPAVFMDASLARLELLEVEGKPAVLKKAVPVLDERLPFMAVRGMAVIERYPSAEAPGIVLHLYGTGTEEDMLAAATFVVRQARELVLA